MAFFCVCCKDEYVSTWPDLLQQELGDSVVVRAVARNDSVVTSKDGSYICDFISYTEEYELNAYDFRHYGVVGPVCGLYVSSMRLCVEENGDPTVIWPSSTHLKNRWNPCHYAASFSLEGKVQRFFLRIADDLWRAFPCEECDESSSTRPTACR